jgi:hypothetical protein
MDNAIHNALLNNYDQIMNVQNGYKSCHSINCGSETFYTLYLLYLIIDTLIVVDINISRLRVLTNRFVLIYGSPFVGDIRAVNDN